MLVLQYEGFEQPCEVLLLFTTGESKKKPLYGKRGNFCITV